jgi:glucosamine--fructose-6-phosphate aminotransferase (isomerizing)
MCGIFGYVSNKEEALGPILIAAAERLTYRGYDSVGAATINNGKIDLRKDTGKVDSVAVKYNIAEMRGQRGITQLRWATFGEPSQVNSQPHLDSNGDMVGAHNGNVVNNVELRLDFMAEGMTVRSQNDGETCVHAVERYIKRGYEFIDAIRLAYGDLQGDYAFVIGRANDDKLYAFKKGSGMVIGIGDGFTCLSSDLPSILPLTREVIRPQDGEIVTLWADRVEVRSVKDGKIIQRMPETVTESMDAVQKGGYPHFMLKEIHEQAQVARELIHLLDGSPDVQPLVEKMKNARHLYLIGCGTSYHAAAVGSVYIAQLAGLTAIPVLAPQFIAQYAPAVGYEDVGIFVSQSGETKDVLNALDVDEGDFVLSTLVLRIRNQRARHEDIYQPGRDVFVYGVQTRGQRYERTFAHPRIDGADDRDGRSADRSDRKRHQRVERYVLSRLRRDVSDRFGRRIEIKRNYVRPLRRHALDRVQTRTTFCGEQGIPDRLCRGTERCAAHHQRDQRSQSPRRTHDHHRRRGRPPARQRR